MERISKKNGGSIDSLSDLPERYKLYEAFYENPMSEMFIPNELRGNIFAIVGTDTKDRTISLLTYYADNDSNLVADVMAVARQIMSTYGKDKAIKLHPEPLSYARIGNEQLRKTILLELKKKTSKNRKNNKGDQKAGEQISFAENVLRQAMEMKASDLHIESDGNRAVIRLRVNKELNDFIPLTHQDAENLSNIFYSTFVRGNEDDQEQGSGSGVYLSSNLLDGEFSRMIGDINMKARMVNIGQNYQDKYTMVLRLIDKNKAVEATPYVKMGFSRDTCGAFRRVQSASRGMILICGVTGSGKSTTMQNMIQHERDRCGNSRKIYSLEQPIEQVMNRVTQINSADSHESNDGKDLDSSQDFSFENLNRMLMRGDPDSIAYGEIRDNATAKASIKGVESGHLVYGTMHVSEAMGVFSRFETFGIETEKVCRKSFLQMALYQHLIPKLCPHCSIKYTGKNDVPQEFGEFHAVKSFKFSDGRGLDISKIQPIASQLKRGESLLRALQYEAVLSSRDVTNMRQKILSMNEQNDDQALKSRVDALMVSSTLTEDELNVRFRGNGCKHCFNGTSGIVPATEVLIPDEQFLELVMSKKLNKAEAYWKSKLGGRSATRDTYDKILSGEVDPRMVETELTEIGG